MQSQPSSSLSIEDMEAVMAAIEGGTPAPAPTAVVTSIVPPLEPEGLAGDTPLTVENSGLKLPIADVVPDPVMAPTVTDPDTRLVSSAVKVAAATPAPVTPAPTKPKSPIIAYVDAEQLARDVSIDPLNLDQACVEHAAKFVHYAERRALSRRQHEKMKAAFEILESQLYAEKREELSAAEETVTDAKGKEITRKVKPTEAQIDAAVKGDRRWWSAKNRVIDAQFAFDLAQNAGSAFEQRRDMIVQMGSDRRIERSGELRIQATQSRREDMMDQIKRNAANG
jgi:hypothetical protein